jgi:hypothetical protein
LSHAAALAPQVPVIRIRAAYALMMRHEFSEAARLLKPLANGPQTWIYGTYAHALLGYADQGKPPDASVSVVLPH